jgi:NADH-quinone oxidoreductase subunit N
LGGLLIFFLTSLIGIPFTGGFFGKFYSFSAAVSSGAVWLAIVGLLNSGLAAGYYLRLAAVVAQRPEAGADSFDTQTRDVGIAVGAALLLTAVATLVLGIAPGRVLNAAQSGASTFNGSPLQIEAPAVATDPQPTP